MILLIYNFFAYPTLSVLNLPTYRYRYVLYGSGSYDLEKLPTFIQRSPQKNYVPRFFNSKLQFYYFHLKIKGEI